MHPSQQCVVKALLRWFLLRPQFLICSSAPQDQMRSANYDPQTQTFENKTKLNILLKVQPIKYVKSDFQPHLHTKDAEVKGTTKTDHNAMIDDVADGCRQKKHPCLSSIDFTPSPPSGLFFWVEEDPKMEMMKSLICHRPPLAALASS